MINRRTFLTTATQGTIGALALTGFDRSKAMAATKLTKIGLQLYTVRNEMGKDFEGTLKRVAEIGYNQVEFAGYYNHSPAEVKAILDRYGLTAPSVHVPLADIQTKLDTAIEAAKVIGHKLI